MRPDTATARRYVMVSLVGLLILGTYRGKTGGEGLAKRLWGVGMLGLFLTLAADVAPTVAGPFAILVLLGYATAGGDAAIQNLLGKASGGGASKPARSQVARPGSSAHTPGPSTQ